MTNLEDQLQCEYLIIGSGAGGSTVAFELQKRNQNFIIIEEGINPENLSDTIADNINDLYYNNGATPMISDNNGPVIGYGQGRCVGGSTYVNAGYFSLTSEEIFHSWYSNKLLNIEYSSYLNLINEIRSEINVEQSNLDSFKDRDSLELKKGSDLMNWKIERCDRFLKNCQRNNMCPIGCPSDSKQSMNNTYLKKVTNENNIFYNLKVVKIMHKSDFAYLAIAICTVTKKKISFYFKNLFLSLGPINSFGLLKKNKLITPFKRNSFEFHINFKFIVKFKKNINANMSTVSQFFVREFEKEGVLISASNSEIPYLLSSSSQYHIDVIKDIYKNFEKYAMYVYQIKAYSKGNINNFFGNNFVKYSFDDRDRDQIIKAIKRINRLFSNLDIEFILYPVEYSDPIKSNSDCDKLIESLNIKHLHLVSVHGMSSLNKSLDNNYDYIDFDGKLKNFKNIHICDSSILPTNTGESPQATIMSLVKSNVKKYKL